MADIPEDSVNLDKEVGKHSSTFSYIWTVWIKIIDDITLVG